MRCPASIGDGLSLCVVVLGRGGTLALSPFSPKVPRNVSIAFPQFPMISELSRVLSSWDETVMVTI